MRQSTTSWPICVLTTKKPWCSYSSNPKRMCTGQRHTLCPPKMSTFLYFKELCQKLTDFNDFWCIKLVNFWQSYLKNKKLDVFGTQCSYRYPYGVTVLRYRPTCMDPPLRSTLCLKKVEPFYSDYSFSCWRVLIIFGSTAAEKICNQMTIPFLQRVRIACNAERCTS